MSVLRDKVLGEIPWGKRWERDGVWQCRTRQFSWSDVAESLIFSHGTVQGNTGKVTYRQNWTHLFWFLWLGNKISL